ncbi:MAG: hypothetical protein ACK5VE_03760 [Alphaproteobacteria bacterium]|jgi:hypothetical protein
MKTNFPYIAAAGRMHGSSADYVQSVVALATKDRAPSDAWSYSGGTSTDPTPRRWHTLTELDASSSPTAHDTAAKLRRFAAA